MFQAGNGGFGNGAGPTGPPQRITKRNKDGIVDPPTGDFQRFGAVMVSISCMIHDMFIILPTPYTL